jgi:hypothetical protein
MNIDEFKIMVNNKVHLRIVFIILTEDRVFFLYHSTYLRILVMGVKGFVICVNGAGGLDS